MIKTQFIVTIILLIAYIDFPNSAYSLSSQQRSDTLAIKGRLLDSMQSSPVSFAAIVLKDSASTFESGTLTDSLGYFHTQIGSPGKFILIVNALGYMYVNRSVEITGHEKEVNLGDILLKSDPKLLNEVVITGSKSAIDNQPGKTIINAQHKIFSNSTSGFDLLIKVPGLVFSNGNFLINGNVVPDILVNGRRTPLTIDDLRSIPHEKIERIEILKNPSARFEGDRKAIINIILKERKSSMATIFTEYGRNKYNQASIGGDLDIVGKKISLNLSAGYLNMPGYIQMYNKRRYSENGQRYSLNMNSFVQNKPVYYYFNTQAEYLIDSSNVISVSYRGLRTNTKQYPSGKSEIYLGENSLQSVIGTNSKSDVISNNSTITTEFQHNFKKLGAKINLEGNYGSYDLSQAQKTTNFNLDSPQSTNGIINNANSKIDLGTFNLDFEVPIFNKGLIQTGAKYTSSVTKNKLNSDSLSNNIPRDGANTFNSFIYKEYIYSYYANLLLSFSSFKLETGLRAEITRSNGNWLPVSESFSNNYNSFLPNIQFSKKWSEKDIITASFAKKISRPSFRDLNPFVFIIDPYTQVSGNPRLKSSTYSNLRLDYAHESINIGIGYRSQHGLITQVPFYDEVNNIIIYRLENLDIKRNISLDINFPVQITKWWQLQNSSTFMHDKYSSILQGARFNRSRFNWTNNLINTFTVFKEWQANMSFFYTSPSVYNLYEVRYLSAFDVGLSKTFAKKRMSIKINMNDIFRRRRDVLTVNHLDLYNQLTQFTNTRNFSLRLTYNVGKVNTSTSRIDKKQEDKQNRVKNSFN